MFRLKNPSRVWALRLSLILAAAVVIPACGSGGGGGGTPANPGTLSFSQAIFLGNENGGTATITVSRDGGSLGAVSVNYATSDGSAVGADYTATSGTLSWAAGDSASKTFTVAMTNDALAEGDETVNLALSLPTGGAALGGQSTAVLTIVDNDTTAAGVVQFSSATYTVTEGTPSVTITVTRTGGTTGAASVTYSNPAGGTATSIADYAFTGGTLNWAAGDGASKTFTIGIANDALAEVPETVNLLLSGATGAGLGTTSTAVLTIVDDDSFGTLQFSSAAYSVNESGAVATVTVTRAGGAGGAVGVTYATSNGTAVAGTDYTAATGTLAWGAGDTASKTFSVFLADNVVVDGNRTVNLTLSAPTGGATLAAPTTAVLTILDDDCTLQFTAATFNLAENAGTATVTVSRVGSTLGAVSVDFSNPAGGTATDTGTDYTFAAGTLSWAIGDGASKTISLPINSDSLSEGNETLNLAIANPLGVGAHLGVQVASVATIVDDDVTLGFSAATASLSEAGGSATLTVNRVGASNGAAAVTWTVTGGTATNPADFTGVLTGTLNWASGDVTAKTIVIPVVSDNLAEGDETVMVTLSAPTLAGGNAVLGTNATNTLTIVDDDVNLAFSSATYNVAENVAGGTLTVTVNRTGLSTGACSVAWSIPAGGTATGADYTATPATLNWAAGDSAAKTFTITLVDDLLAEGSETFNLALGSPVGATLGAVNTAVVTIADDDAPGALAYTSATFTVAESVGNALITVSRTGGVGNAVSATWSVTGGTATNPADFTGPLTGTVSWLAGDATSKTITIPIVDDFLVDAAETITLNLTAPTGGATIGAQPTTTVTITDNDVAGSIQFTNATYTVAENVAGGILNVTVSRTGGVGNAVSVDWSITGGTATGGATDYTATPGTLNWAAGDGANKNIAITLTQDTAVEATETILLQIANVTGGAALGAQQTATVNITDDDTSIQLTSATYSANENAGTLTATVTRTGVTTGASSVTWSITGGTATGGGVDFSATPGVINWTAGDATSKTITITLVDDFAVEGNETINLALSAPTGGNLGAQSSAVATILDNDAPGTLQFSSATYSVNEGNVNATITVTRTGGVGGTVGVTYATSNGTATAGADYTATTNTLSWAPGDSANKTFNVAISPDVLTEGSETVNLTLSLPTGGATLGAPNPAVLTILDAAGVITFSSPTYSVNENGVNATVTVNRLEGSGGAVSVNYATSNGSATAGSDYTTATGTLNWPDGDTAAKTFNVPVANDTTGEGNETVNLALSALTGGAIFGANNSAVLTIVDDDTSLVFSSSTYSVNENVPGGLATITVNRIGVLTNPVTVDWMITGGSAAGGGTDFTATPATLSWGAGVGGAKTFTIAITDDGTMESSETVNLGLQNPTGGATLTAAPNAAILTIVDNDGPDITITQSTVIVEGTGGPGTTTYPFTVQLSAASASTVTVDFATADGTATVADGDYTPTNGTLTFTPGQILKSVSVTITRDTKHELDETFSVGLSNAVGGQITVPSATGTIFDDDPVPSISINDVTQNESIGGPTSFTFTVTLSTSTFQTVTVNYATADGTATTANNDYQAASNTVTFSPFVTSQNVTITVNGDSTVEANETFFVNLSSPTNATILDGQGVGTITNDDGPTVTNAVPSNGSPSVSPGTNLVLDFSMAMDPATFVSGTTVLISPDPSGGAITAANRIQFFWNASFTQVTLAFDTKLPLGIYGDDVLASGTVYAVTLVSGASGVKSSSGTGSIPMVANYVTGFTTYTTSTNPTVLTIAPNISANNPVPAGTTVFTVTWSQAMVTTQGRIQIQSSTGFEAEAEFGQTFTGVTSMVWSGGNTILTVTLSTGVPSNSLFRFRLENFNGATGGFYSQNNDIVFATPGPTGTAPTLTARFPASGATGVPLHQEILLGFSAPMWPADLLDAAKVVVSGTGIVEANLQREVLDFSGIFISAKNGWPASTVITVTVNTTVRNAAGVNIAAASSASFTTAAADTTAMTIDAQFSTMSTGASDLATTNFNANFQLLRGGGNRAFVNRVSLAPRDVSLTESTSPFAPIKGYSLRGDHGLEVQSDNGFTGLKYNQGYLLTINPTFLNSNGGVMSTAGGANVVAFTTKLNAGAVARPVIFGGNGDSKYFTKPGNVKAELRLEVQSPTSTPLTVTAADGAFTPTLSSTGGQSFEYQSAGNEPGLATAGNRTLTFTVTDTPTGTHTITIKNKMYVFDTTIYPTLSTPAGSATPTLSWTALSAPMQTAAPVFAAGIVKQGFSDPAYIVLLPGTATSFTVPADQALSSGTYTFLLHFFTPTDGTFQGAAQEGETISSGTFIVP